MIWSCLVRQSVPVFLEKSGIKLEWEIKRLGLFEDGAMVEPFLGKMI